MVCFFLPTKVVGEELQINHFNEVTHLEIPNIAAADYEIKKNEDKLELKIDALSIEEQKKLSSYTDRYIKKIEIKKNTNLSKDIVTFYFNEKNIELFDYLTDAPSSLSIDLFSKDEADMNQAELELTRSQKLQKKVNKKIPEFDFSNPQRGLASAEFIKSIGHVTIDGDTAPVKKDAENEKEREKKKREVNKDLLKIVRLAKMDEQDLLRFDADRLNFSKDSLIEGNNKIYIKYPALISEHDFLKEILQKNVRYDFTKSEDPVSTDFFKINKLFAKEDFKSFLKALIIFKKKHPQSKFDEMLAHMEAESYLKLYQAEGEKAFFDRSLKIYDAILIKYPDSPVSERTLLLIGYLRQKDKDYFNSARNFKLYVKRYPASPLKENVELLLAQTLIRLHQFEDSQALYMSLLNSHSEDIRSIAQYELGDIYFEQKDYQKAKKAYLEALQKYPGNEKMYPNVYFNLGEAHFLLGDYKQCLNNLRQFIQLHPTHDHAAFAWTRMGEIFELSEVEEKIWRGYFNEAYFRFQNKTGGIIAHLNILYHQAIDAPKKKLEYIIDQIRNYENKINLPQSEEYLHFKISDIYYEEGEYEKSIQTLMNHFKSGLIPHHAEKFHKRIGRGLAANLRSLIDQNRLEEGVTVFDKTDDLWFKKSERFDYSFYKGELFRLSKNYAKAYAEYEKYITAYGAVKDKENLEKTLRLPFIDDVKIKMAECALQMNKLDLAKKEIKSVKIENMTLLKSKDSFYYQSALIANADENYAEAKANLLKLSSLHRDAISLLVDISLKLQKPNEAIAVIDGHIENSVKDEKERFIFLKRKLDILESSDNKKFQDFLPRFYSEFKEKDYDFDREKYLLGKDLMGKNKEKEAKDVFSKISATSYWAKLASEAQADEQWNQKYKKYINRIPAMESAKEKK